MSSPVQNLFDDTKTAVAGEVYRATGMNFIARLVEVISQALAFLILARLIDPSDFGLVSMATPFIGPIAVLGDLGLSAAILQTRTIDRRQASALLYIGIAAGIALFALAAVLFPLVARLYEEPRVLPIGLFLSTTFIISGFTGVQRSLLRRALQFRTLLYAQIVSSTAMLVVSFVLAYLGTGYWALASVLVTGPLGYSMTIWILCRWVPKKPEWGAHTRHMISYGNFYLGYLVLNTIGRQADNILIGWRYGSAALGPYAFAFRLFMLPNQQFFGPLEHVMVPSLSRLRDDPATYRVWFLQALKYLSFAAFLPSMLLAATSHDIVEIVAGARWHAADVIISVLAPVGALQAVVNSCTWLMQSQGRADRMFRWSLGCTSVFLISFVAGISWGPLGVAAAYGIANVAVTLPSITYAAKTTLITVPDALSAAAPGLLVGVIVYIEAAALNHMLAETGNLVRYATELSLPLVTGLLAIFVLGGHDLRTRVRGMLRSRRGAT